MQWDIELKGRQSKICNRLDPGLKDGGDLCSDKPEPPGEKDDPVEEAGASCNPPEEAGLDSDLCENGGLRCDQSEQTGLEVGQVGEAVIKEDPSEKGEQSENQEVAKSRRRVKSLDAFRGLSIVIMIFVNYGGGGYYFFAQ